MLFFRGVPDEIGLDHAQRRPAKQPMLPWFLWLFVAMVGLNSAGALPALLTQGLNEVSRACLVTAIAALGLKTSMAQLARAGWLPLLMVGAETFWLALFVGTAIALVR
jgi:uncharacterized membrane protein YadS